MSSLVLYQPFYDSKVTPKNKKYSVYIKDGKKIKVIHFGDRSMEHYYDSTSVGRWSHLNHLDPERRRLYRARASGIKDKAGNLTYLNKNSPNYWSYHYLW